MGSTWKARLLLFLLHRLYHEFSWAYDLVSYVVSGGQWRTWQRVALPFVRGIRVLEVAFGPGHLLVDLARRRYECYGLDASWQMVRAARRNLRRNQAVAHICQGKAQQLPFPTNAFDTVVLTFPPEFVAEQEALQELYRVTAPGGRLLVVEGGRVLQPASLGRLINRAYDFLGEPGDYFESLDRYRRCGFQVKLQEVRTGRGQAQLVVAEKPIA
ncbi:MAG: methyltransferase domain-containing protein [Chloroflexota bacterium]